MASEIPDRWVLLRLRFSSSGVLWLSYQDDQGKRRVLTGTGDQIEDWIELHSGTITDRIAPKGFYGPPDLFELILETILSLPDRLIGFDVTKHVPLPVFVDPPLDHSEMAWEKLIRELLEPHFLRECFKLTNSSFQKLRENKVPEPVLESLKSLEDKEFVSEKELSNAVDKQLKAFEKQLRSEPGISGPLRKWTLIGQKKLLLEHAHCKFDKFFVTRLARSKWRVPPKFYLPLRVAAIGPKPFSNNILKDLESVEWYKDSADVQEYGMQLHRLDPKAVPRFLRSETLHILIVTEDLLEGILERTRSVKRANRPRLLVYFSVGAPSVSMMKLPAGMSLLRVPVVPDEVGAEIIKTLIYGVIHDYPLHEAAAEVTIKYKYLLTSPLQLWSDPKTNQALRISDAFVDVINDALDLKGGITPGNIDGFLARVDVDARKKFSGLLHQAKKLVKPINESVDEGLRLEGDFRRETWGLTPLAQAKAKIETARKVREKLSNCLAKVSADFTSVEKFKKYQERRVDIALERLEYSPLLDPRQRVRRNVVWVDPTVALRRRASYRLRVSIGHKLPGSLFAEEPPPLDPLLPDPEDPQGHQLEVVVYGLDFKVLSPRVQMTYLPLLGASQPVYFTVRAPSHLGDARLRVAIYYRNHILQSFLVKAQIAQEENRKSSMTLLTAELEFSRTERFSNLDELPPRMMSVGLNSGPKVTHSFMMKRNQEAHELHFAEGVIDKNIKLFREFLYEATYVSPKKFRFTTKPELGSPRTVEFEKAIRRFARVGRKLFEAIFARHGRKVEDELRAIANSSDQIIQVLRYDPNYPFPWPIVYDFTIHSDTDSPVCPGVLNGNSHVPCKHGPKDHVFCVRGFWGVRHHLEEFIVCDGARKDGEREVKKSQTAPLAHFATGLEKKYTENVTAIFNEKPTSNQIRVLKANEDLIELLWQDDKRPPVVIVLGHFSKKVVDKLEESGISLTNSPKFLTPSQILERRFDHCVEWDQPRPIFLLMACGSIAIDTNTLNSFVTSLTKAGALAVVGTENDVSSAFASRFAGEVTRDLLQSKPPKPLGKAVTEFRRRLLQEKNPLGFVITSFGDADLTIV